MKYAHGWMMAMVAGLAGLCAVTVGCQSDGEVDYVEIDQEESVGDYEPYEQEPMLGEPEPMMGREPTDVAPRFEPVQPDERRIDYGDDAFDDELKSDPFYDVPHVPE